MKYSVYDSGKGVILTVDKKLLPKIHHLRVKNKVTVFLLVLEMEAPLCRVDAH